MTTLSERAMLVTMKLSVWTGQKLDRDETTALNRSHGLTVEAARVNKKLLPFGAELDRVKQTTGAIRKEFAQRTLPWGIDGIQILKASAYVDFTALVNQWQGDWQSSVDAFLDAYPTLRRQAYLDMGTLFKRDDYPETEDLRQRFGFSIRFMPVPDDRDWRVDVGDEERQRLQDDIRQRLVETEQHAMLEAWRRVRDLVEKTHERLRDPENRFKDTLVSNAIELCSVLPSLNITDDPALEKARQQLEKAMAPYAGNLTPLRDDLKVRATVTRQMDAILKKMGGVYAAPSSLIAA